tara:strand:+ start:3793 stop:3942 length:150 start_codon:yes stop_codon:yes gene_type:complete
MLLKLIATFFKVLLLLVFAACGVFAMNILFVTWCMAGMSTVMKYVSSLM